MNSISFAGTAKNTGKTTTCLRVMDEARGLRSRMRLALTSIGYDGELKDHVTGLPKPRYLLRAGEWIATAEKCLRAGTAEVEAEQRTGIRTALGEVILARVRREGLVMLAGPNRSSDLQAVLAKFAAAGVDLALVDGALNRLAPMIVTDGLALATGASFDTDIEVVAEHARALCGLFAHPLLPGSDRLPVMRIAIVDRLGGKETLHTGSLLGEGDALALAEIGRRAAIVSIPGACDPRLVERMLVACPVLWLACFVFGSPLKLAASGDPRRWAKLAREGLRIYYRETLPLRVLTVNPFYPRFLPGQFAYEPASVDPVELLNAVQDAVPNVKVTDIRQEAVELLDLLELR